MKLLIAAFIGTVVGAVTSFLLLVIVSMRRESWSKFKHRRGRQ